MKVLRSAGEMSKTSQEARRQGKRISLIPTMGGLHEGHLSLFREGKKQGDLLVVSIFVNPTQFNDRSDFEKYPRDLEGDLQKCAREAVDIVFAPEVEEIYPPGEAARPIPLPAVAEPLEGASRPGHFAGVVRVVLKLFRIVRPHLAVFGLKDYQQFRVIRETVIRQKMDVEIVPHPIVRTPEGLALSSRNDRLSPDGRTRALCLSRSLQAAESLFLKGERDPRKIEEEVREILRGPSVRIDYARVVDAETLEGIREIRRPTLVALAAFVEGVRLIDNCILDAT